MSGGILLCFASRFESRHFRAGATVLHTGIGRKRACGALRSFLRSGRPGLIVSSGFAGALNPRLERHQAVYSTSGDHPLFGPLSGLGFLRGSFHCQDDLAATARQKSELWRAHRRDAVEMESGALEEIALSEGIPFLALRAISDTAGESLPLDFSRFMTPDWRLDPLRLAGHLAAGPWRALILWRFCRSLSRTSRSLGMALERVCRLHSSLELETCQDRSGGAG